jgi:hypothetical protein
VETDRKLVGGGVLPAASAGETDTKRKARVATREVRIEVCNFKIYFIWCYF